MPEQRAPVDLNHKRRAGAAEAALVGIAAIWGLTFVMVQDAIAFLPVMTFLGYRFAFAAVVVAFLFRHGLKRLPAGGWRAGLLMSAFLTAGYVTQTLGLARTTVSNAGFITGLFVVLTPVFGALVFKQRAGALAWTAAGVSTAGLLLLSGAGDHVSLLGDGLVVLTACSFALHILATGRAVGVYEVGPLLAVQVGGCGTFCLAVAVIAGDLALPREAPVWSALVVTALLATALGFFVQTYAQRHTGPARTALILASEPAFAGLFAFVLNGETLSAPGWLGALLIMSSIVTVELVPYLRTRRPLPEG